MRLRALLVAWPLLVPALCARSAPALVTMVTTLAGGSEPGFADGTGPKAKFNRPMGLAVDARGNVIVADTFNHRIRKITRAGVVTTIAGSQYPGLADGKGERAEFNHPSGVAVDRAGNLIVADTDNDRIRSIAPDGTVTTLAGSTMGYRDGQARVAQFDSPYAVAVDAAGNLFVADGANRAIRKITPAGLVSTIAGGSRQPAIGFPGDLAATNDGSVYAVIMVPSFYVNETGQKKPLVLHRVLAAGSDGATRVIPLPPMSDGSLITFANSRLTGIALDRDQTLIVTDSGDVHCIRRINADRQVFRIAGNGPGFVNGHVRAARFNKPTGVVVDARGMIYVADSENNAIRVIDRFAKEEKRPAKIRR